MRKSYISIEHSGSSVVAGCLRRRRLGKQSGHCGTIDPYAAVKVGFSQTKTGTATAAVSAGAVDGGASAVTQAYYGSLVPPFCNAAARGFFQQVAAAGL